jgi:hypothetical protein
MQRLRQALGLSGNSGSSTAAGSSMRNRPRQTPGSRPSLFDRNKPFFTGVHRFGVAKLGLYFTDPFHTLLNLPWWRFILVFFATYVLQFLTFALIYLGVSKAHTPAGDACIAGVDGSLAHALWMSSRTASTIGFNDIVPAPDCPAANFVVMIQVGWVCLLRGGKGVTRRQRTAAATQGKQQHRGAGVGGEGITRQWHPQQQQQQRREDL